MITVQIPHYCRAVVKVGMRWTAVWAGSGLLVQAGAGGCSQTLNDLADIIGQHVMEGVGAGVSSLTEAFLLSLAA